MDTSTICSFIFYQILYQINSKCVINFPLLILSLITTLLFLSFDLQFYSKFSLFQKNTKNSYLFVVFICLYSSKALFKQFYCKAQTNVFWSLIGCVITEEVVSFVLDLLDLKLFSAFQTFSTQINQSTQYIDFVFTKKKLIFYLCLSNMFGPFDSFIPYNCLALFLKILNRLGSRFIVLFTPLNTFLTLSAPEIISSIKLQSFYTIFSVIEFLLMYQVGSFQPEHCLISLCFLVHDNEQVLSQHFGHVYLAKTLLQFQHKFFLPAYLTLINSDSYECQETYQPSQIQLSSFDYYNRFIFFTFLITTFQNYIKVYDFLFIFIKSIKSNFLQIISQNNFIRSFYRIMLIKAACLPQIQKLNDTSYQSLKKQCRLTFTTQNYKKSQQYLQVNYLKDYVYKISPQKHRKVPLLKEQQNLRDFLFEVKNDQQRLLGVNNELKNKFFRLMGKGNSNNQTAIRKMNLAKNNKISKLSKQKTDPAVFQMFDPIQFLEQKQQRKKSKLAKIISNKPAITFLSQDQSVSFIDKDPFISFPSPLNKKNTSNFKNSFNQTKLSKQKLDASKSISKLLQNSARLQQNNKGRKKLKNYRSRNQLDKDNQKIIKTQRKHILSMIQMENKGDSHNIHRLSVNSVNQIPPKEKYAIDFISYLRTKTKQQLDKLIYEKLIKKPQKDLQKFQQFILKEVKFQNQQNKHKIQRFFLKMRQQFRKVQKYKKNSKFDWRSRSMHLEQLNKFDQKWKVNKFNENKPQQVFRNSQNKVVRSKKIRNLRPIQKIIENENIDISKQVNENQENQEIEEEENIQISRIIQDIVS